MNPDQEIHISQLKIQLTGPQYKPNPEPTFHAIVLVSKFIIPLLRSEFIKTLNITLKNCMQVSKVV